MSQSRKPSLRDVVRLGQDVATAKANMKPKQWALIVKAAHARGVTVAGALSGGPTELQARTKASLKAQADKTVADSYAPAYADLDAQEKKVTGLSEKRRVDNAAYREWVTTTNDRLQGDARAADAALDARLHTIQTDTQNAWQDTAAQAHANAQAAAGTVSDTSQSKALNSLGAAAANSNEKMAASRAAMVQQSGNAVAGMSVAGAAMLAATEVDEAKRVGDETASRTKITDARTKYKLDQAADSTKGLNDLLAGEASKAQAAQELGIAADKLGVDMAKLDYTKLKDSRDYGLAEKKFDLDEWTAKNKAATEKAKIELGYDEIAAREGRSAADAALKKWVTKYNRSHPQATTPGGRTSAERKVSQTQYASVNTIKGQLVDLHRRYPKGVSNGGKTLREILRSRGYDDVSIDIAEDIRRHGGKISEAGRAKARAIGILNPEKLWPVA